MGLLSSLGKLVGNTLYHATGASASAKQQFEYQKKLQEQQNQYNVYNMQHQYQWTMKDIQQAGLNPILAASNGSNSVGAVGAGSAIGGTSQGDILGAINSAVDLALKRKKNDSDIKLQETMADLNTAKKAETLETTKNITPQAEATVKKLNSEAAVNSAEKTLKETQVDNIKQDTELKNAQKWATYHQNQKADAQRDLTKKQVKYYEAEQSAKALSSLLKK